MDGTGQPDLTCVICWKSSLDPRRSFINWEDKQKLRICQKFYSQVLTASGSTCQGGIGGMASIGFPSHFSLCLKCFVLLKRATDRRDDVSKVEARVLELQQQEMRYVPQLREGEGEIDLKEKELQQQIVALLNELRGRLARYFNRMKMIAEIINNVSSDKSVHGEAPVTQWRGEILRIALERKIEPTSKLQLLISSLAFPCTSTTPKSVIPSDEDESDVEYDQKVANWEARARARTGENNDDDDDSMPIISAEFAVLAVSTIAMGKDDNLKSRIPANADISHAIPSTSSGSSGISGNVEDEKYKGLLKRKPSGSTISQKASAGKILPQRHLKESKPFKCYMCTKSFAKIFQLRLHRLYVHKK